MDYVQLLKNTARQTGSIICMGMDPVLDDIPLPSGTPGEKIFSFYEKILNTLTRTRTLPGAVKPNYAFYARYGLEGIEVLQRLIALCRDISIPVILDVKRGDIGKTAAAYAEESFDFFNADAVTVAPYMGFDSIQPFLADYPGKGCYVLTRTSNRSAVDFQDLLIENEKLYMVVAKKIVSWYVPGLGSVTGATYPKELGEINSIFSSSGNEIPLLIPGVGAQGGDLSEVCSILSESGSLEYHRINSSSGINYAYRDYPGYSYDAAAREELARLNGETERFI